MGSWFPTDNSKRTLGEYINAFGSDPSSFWGIYSPIYPLQELDAEFDDSQARYLHYLMSLGEHVVIDETRLHYRIEALRELDPEAFVVHLHRSVGGFVSSHLRPSRPPSSDPLRRLGALARGIHNKMTYWSRMDLPPGVQREEVIGRRPGSKFGLLLEKAGYRSEEIMLAPANARLFAYWHFHCRRIEYLGPILFGDRFRSVAYETFAQDPAGTMASLYGWIGLQMPAGLRYPEVRTAVPVSRAHRRRWNALSESLGFSSRETESLQR